ncbi:FAD-binding oxidoreductase [Mesorhizobium sp. M1156]
MIECEAAGPITARSTMELLSAAYPLHPAFGEAELIEAGVGVRPAFADNLPRVEREDKNIRINGVYRLGFLLAPAMTRQVADIILGNPARPSAISAERDEEIAVGFTGANAVRKEEQRPSRGSVSPCSAEFVFGFALLGREVEPLLGVLLRKALKTDQCHRPCGSLVLGPRAPLQLASSLENIARLTFFWHRLISNEQ